MNYYPHHIGDFNTGTLHLSRLERGIYRDMRDLYFDKEAALPADQSKLFRLLRVSTPEEIEAAKNVLGDFFVLTEAGWVNADCEAGIQAYYDGLEASSAGGKAAKKKREEKARLLAEQQAAAAALAQSTLDFTEAQYAQSASTLPEQCANSTGTVRDGANQNQNQNHNQNQSNSVAPPTLSEDRARGATPVELSVALRKHGVNCQPADPRLITLAAQGMSVATAEAACDEARRSKPSPQVIALGYVVSIIGRWASEASAIDATGALPPARASPGGYESTKDRERRETLAGLIGTEHEPAPKFIDINTLA